MRSTKALLLILSLALTTSCMVGPNYRTPDAKIEQQWTYNSGASGRQIQRDDASWWKTFKDPVLNTFIHHEDFDLAGILFHELAHFERIFWFFCPSVCNILETSHTNLTNVDA